MKERLEAITSFIESSCEQPLYIIGSGGSLSAAHMVKLLHEDLGGHAKVITPYELLTSDTNFRNSNILLLTAGGRNPDIIFAFKHAAKSEPRNLMAVCMRPKSILKEIEKTYNYAKVVEFDIPSGKDGFLATNSLIAFCTLFSHAYNEVKQHQRILPLEKILKIDEFKESIENDSSLRLKTYSVLYGKWSLPAAFDLESKFTEAALGNVQLADFRNFAHGRHYFLAKNFTNSCVIAIYTQDEEKIVNKTLDQIPEEIPIYRITSDFDGPDGALQLLIKILYFVNFIAESQNVDPGCPTVPMFGRKIYRLNVNSVIPKEKIPPGLSRQEYVAIKRKVDFCVLNDPENLSLWIKSFQEFIKKIKAGKFGSIIFDYDGTLISQEQRFSRLSPEICSALTHLVENDIVIGIATGRGKSVREELQRAIPQKYWNSVIIGYYNGADIGKLSEDNHPNKDLPTDPDLKKIDGIFKKDKLFLKYLNSDVIGYDLRPKQISITFKRKIFKNSMKSRVIEALTENNLCNLKFLESSHSYDIITQNVSKKDIVSIVRTLAEQKGKSTEVLCIGDKGKYPGNDFELLQTSIALSVDEVSNCCENCWNIAPEGYRGEQATLKYLHLIKIYKNYFGFNFHSGDTINE